MHKALERERWLRRPVVQAKLWLQDAIAGMPKFPDDALVDQQLDREIETVFLMADPRHQAIASRLVKEIARLDGAIDNFVSPAVAARVRAKVKKSKQSLRSNYGDHLNTGASTCKI